MNNYTANDIDIFSGKLYFPYFGAFSGTLILNTNESLTDTEIELKYNDAVILCSLQNQEMQNNMLHIDIIAGYNCWNKIIKAKSYSTNGNIKKSIILNDAALECGEKINTNTIDVYKNKYIRARGNAGNILKSEKWYIDYEKITQVRDRDIIIYDDKYQILKTDVDNKLIDLLIDNPFKITPGMKFDDKIIDYFNINIGSSSIICKYK